MAGPDHIEELVTVAAAQKQRRKQLVVGGTVICLITSAVGYIISANMRTQMQDEFNSRAAKLEESLQKVSAITVQQKREIDNLTEETKIQKRDLSELENAYAKTSKDFADLMANTRPIAGFRVEQTAKDRGKISEVLCEKGEIKLSLPQNGFSERSVLVSAAGIELRSATRTLEISEKGIILYESAPGERLGNVLWQTNRAPSLQSK